MAVRPSRSLIDLVKNEPFRSRSSFSEFSREPYLSELEAYYEAARAGEVPGRCWAHILRKLRELHPEIVARSPESLRQFICNSHPEWLEGI